MTHPALTSGPIYLDYNATTPVDLRVADAAQPYLAAHFGNPSSAHQYASAPAQAMQTAREQVAALIGSAAETIVFTGSGSEANNLALRGVVLADPTRRRRRHVITQSTEHPAVLATCRALQRLHDVDVTFLPVDRHGLVDPEDLAATVTPQTALVSIMLANNETGTIQPIAELASIAHAHDVPIHTDAAQAVGKIPIDVAQLGVDLLTVAGHKLYAPKGVGALYLRPGLRLEPVIYGGGQEGGLRAGTENVAQAVALGAAADLARADLATGGTEQLRTLRNRLQEALFDRLPSAMHVNGHPDRRLPNTVNISILGLSGSDLLAAVPGVAASTGSACHAGLTEPSPVLSAMGLDPGRALAAVRLSVGRWTTIEEVDRAATLLTEAARDLVAHPQPTATTPVIVPT
jgi:cysteine desulfurase